MGKEKVHVNIVKWDFDVFKWVNSLLDDFKSSAGQLLNLLIRI